MNIIKAGTQWEVLKSWIENTKLFNVIKEETGRQGMLGVLPVIIARDPPLVMHLSAGVVISRAEDLPEEVIEEFYRNSPYYNYNHEEHQYGEQETIFREKLKLKQDYD